MDKFDTVEEYLEALSRDPRGFAIISMNAAATALDLARSSAERMAADGRLTLISMPGLKGVRARDVSDILNAKREERRKVVAVLEKAAHQQKPVFYDAVMSPIGLDHTLSVDRNRIGHILGRISRESHQQDGILLSVLVHKKGRKLDETLPSDAFFGLAEDLDLDVSDKRAFVKRQMRLVYKHYASK